MTKIIEFFGGPGCGKSTTAALVFSKLKDMGINTELVGEVAKERAWEGRPIKGFAMVEVTVEQMAREARLYGKVDVIVTDSPAWLGPYYARDMCFGENLADLVSLNETYFMLDRLSIFLNRTKKFNPAGRFHGEEEANKVDKTLLDFILDKGVDVYHRHTTEVWGLVKNHV